MDFRSRPKSRFCLATHLPYLGLPASTLWSLSEGHSRDSQSVKLVVYKSLGREVGQGFVCTWYTCASHHSIDKIHTLAARSLELPAYPAMVPHDD
eukprot:5561665-Amphidinium_carterae.1